MPGNVVGTAEIVVIADTTPFEEGLKADTDSAFAKVSSDAGVAGQDAGQSLAGGFGRGAHDLEDEAKRKGDAAGKGFADKLSGHLSSLGNTLSNSGIPGLSSLGKGLSKAGDEAGGKAKGLNDQLSKLGGAALLGTGVAFAAVGFEAVKMASNFQQATTSIANTEGISTKAADAIGNAFLGTAGKSKFSAQEMADAFAPVSGQLKVTQGSALTTAQTLSVMTAAGNLAEAKQIDLGTATTALASTMQAFQIKAKDASKATDILYNASNATGYGVDQLSQQFMKMHSKLGDLGGGLKDFGGLLVALIHDGFSGRAAMTALSGGVTTLLKPQVQMTEALRQSKIEMAQFSPAVQKLLAGYLNGSVSSKAYNKEVKALDPAMQQQIKSFLSQNTALEKAKAAIDAQGIATVDATGKFVGWSKIIDELQPKFKHMTELQQIAYSTTLFGAGAAKQLTKVIDSGSSSYERATSAVSKQGSAQHAAEVQGKTLAAQMQELRATVDDLFTQFGERLIPVVLKVAKVFADATLYVVHHKALLVALGVLIGGTLATVIGVFAVNKMVAFGKSFANATEAVGNLIKKLPFFNSATQEAGDAAQASADEQQAAMDETATTTQETSVSMQSAIDGLVASFETLGTAVQNATTQIETALGTVGPAADEAGAQVDGGLSTIGTNAEGAAERVGIAMDQIVASARGAAGGVASATGEMDAAFVGVGGSAEGAAAKVGAAALEEQGSMDATAATAATTAAEVDTALASEGGAGALGGLGLAAGGAGAAARGGLGAGAAAEGGAVGLGALANPLVIGAGIAAYLGTDTILHHTALGDSVIAAADQILTLFGHNPNAHGFNEGAIKSGSGTNRLIAEHGGIAGYEKWWKDEGKAAYEKIHDGVTRAADRAARNSEIERQQLSTISGTLLGQDVLPKDVRILDRAGLGKDIGTPAGDQIAERIVAYLNEAQQKGLRVNEGTVKTLIGELNIHDAKSSADDIVRELAWAVHTGRLGAMR